MGRVAAETVAATQEADKLKAENKVSTQKPACSSANHTELPTGAQVLLKKAGKTRDLKKKLMDITVCADLFLGSV